MPYKLSEPDIHQYHTQGYVVFRRILPTSLITDLRKQADRACEIARKKDSNAQRLQPIAAHPDIDQRPFEDFANLPELVDAIKQLVTPDASIGGPSRAGILFEPAQRPWATSWHRDFGPIQQRVDLAEFRRLRIDPRYFHQVNCALYEDTCTWYVPGSHLRDDFPAEDHLGRNSPWQIGFDQKDLTPVELERFCLEYVESMPRAMRLDLGAGDFCLYRNHGWHLGNYVPYKRRATLHDSVWTAQWKAAYERWAAGGMMTATPE